MRFRLALVPVAVGLAFAVPAHAAERVLYVGDSLGVGTTPQLARLMGSEAQIQGNSLVGRPSPQGVSVLRQLYQPSDHTVVFDLGSNDDMANPGVLAADLASARQISRGSCMIVATLNRPPFNGATIDGLNRVLESFAAATPDVQLVDWHAFAHGQPGILGPDGVHPTPQGYALRAELFAEAVAACATGSVTPPAAGAAPPRSHRRARARQRPAPKPIKVPGIEASGISFTEPLVFKAAGARVSGELQLPNTKPPYPAVVMIGGAGQHAGDYLAAHGIAAVTYRERSARYSIRAAEAMAAVAALRARREIAPGAIAVWGLGSGAQAAAIAAAGDPRIAAVIAVSPGLAAASNRAWAVRHVLGGSGTAAVATWLALSASGDRTRDPATAWRRVAQPVLAIWGTADRDVPIRAAAAALRSALAVGPNRDRTFTWFDAGHTVDTRAALAVTSGWLGARLAAGRKPRALRTPLPPSNGGPAPVEVRASGLTSVPIQLAWLALPLILFGLALARGRASAPHGIRLIAIAEGFGAAALASIAAGVAVAIHAHGSVASVAGVPLLFALAFALAAACAVATGALAARRAWIPAAAGALWLALALFWLL